jgi:hypothetical protein
LIRTYLVMESVVIQMALPVMKVVRIKRYIGIAKVNVKILKNLAMESAMI